MSVTSELQRRLRKESKKLLSVSLSISSILLIVSVFSDEGAKRFWESALCPALDKFLKSNFHGFLLGPKHPDPPGLFQ